MSRPVLPGALAALALVLAAAPAAAQGTLRLSQTSSYTLAHLGSGEMQQTIDFGADRQRTATTGKGKVLLFSQDLAGTQIVRLDEGKIYQLDDKKKTYATRSFAELRAELEKAQRSAQQSAQQPAGAKKEEEVRWSVVGEGAKRTGERQTIHGFTTEQVLVKLSVVAEDVKTKEKTTMLYLTGELWVDDSQAEAAKLSRQFAERFARELGMDPRTGANPYARWLQELYGEAAKIPGLAIRSTFLVEMPQAEASGQQQGEPRAAAGDPVGAALGGLLKRARKPAEPAPGSGPTAPGRAVLFRTVTEVTSISRPSDASFEVPAGYRPG